MASKDLFPIDPGEGAIQRCLGTIVRELSLLPGRDIPDVDIVVAHKGDESPIGRELGILFCGCRLGQPGEGGRIQVQQEDVSVEDVKCLLARGIEGDWPGKRAVHNSARLDCFEQIDRASHVQQRTPLSCDWIETLESLLGRREPQVIQDGRTVFQPDKRGHLIHFASWTDYPFSGESGRLGVQPGTCQENRKMQECAQGAVFQSRHIIHPICLLWKLLHLAARSRAASRAYGGLD